MVYYYLSATGAPLLMLRSKMWTHTDLQLNRAEIALPFFLCYHGDSLIRVTLVDEHRSSRNFYGSSAISTCEPRFPTGSGSVLWRPCLAPSRREVKVQTRVGGCGLAPVVGCAGTRVVVPPSGFGSSGAAAAAYAAGLRWSNLMPGNMQSFITTGARPRTLPAPSAPAARINFEEDAERWGWGARTASCWVSHICPQLTNRTGTGPTGKQRPRRVFHQLTLMLAATIDPWSFAIKSQTHVHVDFAYPCLPMWLLWWREMRVSRWINATVVQPPPLLPWRPVFFFCCCCGCYSTDVVVLCVGHQGRSSALPSPAADLQDQSAALWWKTVPLSGVPFFFLCFSEEEWAWCWSFRRRTNIKLSLSFSTTALVDFTSRPRCAIRFHLCESVCGTNALIYFCNDVFLISIFLKTEEEWCRSSDDSLRDGCVLLFFFFPAAPIEPKP